ncbi:MAG: cupin domain-containing protein [Thermodesulfobacteriota bacterium]
MNDYPEFMKNRKNKISSKSQYTEDIEGYVFDGADGSQVAFWKCFKDRVSEEHTHDYDEYMVVVQGRYTLIIGQKRVSLSTGQEYYIPKGTVHAGEAIAGTRTIHVFGGKRAERENEV